MTPPVFRPRQQLLLPRRSPPRRRPTPEAPRQETAPQPYDAESKFGRVTGNNAITWSPSIHDWFETIKLNYGHDFTVGPPRDDLHPLPGPDAPAQDTPDTWRKMDAVLEYWQEMGVDGFRVDMAHMIPMAYWGWQTLALPQTRCRGLLHGRGL